MSAHAARAVAASLFLVAALGAQTPSESAAELARIHGIRVVLASITPVCDCFIDQTTFRPQGKIIGLNAWLKDYAAKNGAVYLDYYSALAAGRDFKKELTADGLLPNDK